MIVIVSKSRTSTDNILSAAIARVTNASTARRKATHQTAATSIVEQQYCNVCLCISYSSFDEIFSVTMELK